MRIGVPLSEALERLIARMPLPEVKFLAIVISIQQQAGGNLSEALETSPAFCVTVSEWK